jgi:hypothetical protein
MNTRSDFENRLQSLREEAAARGRVVTGRGVDVAGGPIPIQRGYYGEGVVRPPVWTWEISTYFFIGGCGGMAAVIGAAALAFGHLEVTRAAMWIAFVAAVLSPALLIADLGRPLLFFNMLRVFKYKSPMSVGSWIVSLFGINAGPGALLVELWQRHFFSGILGQIIAVLAVLFVIGTAFWGMFLATYTGVLIGATAIPAWYLHRVFLPIHFGTAGLGSAAGLLELLGYRLAPLYALSLAAAALETLLWIVLEMRKHGPADRALHEGPSGLTIRSAEFLLGPLALLFRALGVVPASALSFLLGALLSRFGWMEAGRTSGRDPESVFAAQK